MINSSYNKLVREKKRNRAPTKTIVKSMKIKNYELNR